MADVKSMVLEYKSRRDYVYNRLINLGMEVYLPEGAFYIFPSIKKYNMDSETLCELLLKEAKVAVVPGSAFGTGGEGYMRISYSYSIPVLEEGLNRIENWVKK
jgi:aminotransferase